jgi:hypothetical protein
MEPLRTPVSGVYGCASSRLDLHAEVTRPRNAVPHGCRDTGGCASYRASPEISFRSMADNDRCNGWMLHHRENGARKLPRPGDRPRDMVSRWRNRRGFAVHPAAARTAGAATDARRVARAHGSAARRGIPLFKKIRIHTAKGSAPRHTRRRRPSPLSRQRTRSCPGRHMPPGPRIRATDFVYLMRRVMPIANRSRVSAVSVQVSNRPCPPSERMNSPLELHEVRLRGLGGQERCGAQGPCASAPRIIRSDPQEHRSPWPDGTCSGQIRDPPPSAERLAARGAQGGGGEDHPPRPPRPPRTPRETHSRFCGTGGAPPCDTRVPDGTGATPEHRRDFRGCCYVNGAV